VFKHAAVLFVLLDVRADLVVCLDNSINIGEENWNLVIEFIQNVVSVSNVGLDGTHVGLVDVGKLHLPPYIDLF